MNELIKTFWKKSFGEDPTYPGSVERFAELILLKCISIAEAQALQSTKMANSEFVTPTGRTLYEGMYGGAMNVVVGIRERFDIWENQ